MNTTTSKTDTTQAAQTDKANQTANATGVDTAAKAAADKSSKEKLSKEDFEMQRRSDSNYDNTADLAIANAAAGGLAPVVVYDDEGNKIYDPRFDSGSAADVDSAPELSELTLSEQDAGRKALEKHQPRRLKK